MKMINSADPLVLLCFQVMRISMKLFNRTPADLPQDLRQQVVGWLSGAPAGMEGYIRPGCVFLTLHLLVEQTVYAAAMAAGVQSLVQHLLHTTNCTFWWQGTYAIQLGDEMAMVNNGSMTAVHSKSTGQVQLDGSTTFYPHLSRTGPRCILGSQPNAVQLFGENLNTTGCELVVRWKGKQLRPRMQVSASGKAATFTMPVLSGCGVATVEVARGAWMSEAKPLLIVDDAALAAEINGLDKAQAEGVMAGTQLSADSLEALAVDMGLVLQHVKVCGVICTVLAMKTKWSFSYVLHCEQS